LYVGCELHVNNAICNIDFSSTAVPSLMALRLDHEDNEMMRPLVVMPMEGMMREHEQGVDY